jgi:hypothetical protein
LKRVAERETEARSFIKAIRPVRGGLYFLDDDERRTILHTPDIRFCHNDAGWPGIVIEVAPPEKKKSLPGLADNYILRSNGDIGVMVGVNLGGKESKEASISVWRLKLSTNDDGEREGEVEQVVDSQVTSLDTLRALLTRTQIFRDAHGDHVLSPSSSLKLSLKDFALDELTRDVPDLPIEIDSQTLCRLLAEAEYFDHKSTTVHLLQPPQIKKRGRPLTPPPGYATECIGKPLDMEWWNKYEGDKAR